VIKVSLNKRRRKKTHYNDMISFFSVSNDTEYNLYTWILCKYTITHKLCGLTRRLQANYSVAIKMRLNCLLLPALYSTKKESYGVNYYVLDCNDLTWNGSLACPHKKNDYGNVE
jgi:hypothetical protein